MVETISSLESPIDVMLLIHKALRAEGLRAERLVKELEPGSSLQTFKLTFNSWASALVFHAEAELGFNMTADHLKDTWEQQTAWEQNGNAPSPSLQRLTKAMVAQEDQDHVDLIDGLQDVLTILDEDIGKTSIITRTIHHLHGQVVALRITQEDHLETEEALVIPMLRRSLCQERQLAVAKGLLIDEYSQDPRWVLQWVSNELEPAEQILLTDLEQRLPASK